MVRVHKDKDKANVLKGRDHKDPTKMVRVHKVDRIKMVHVLRDLDHKDLTKMVRVHKGKAHVLRGRDHKDLIKMVRDRKGRDQKTIRTHKKKIPTKLLGSFFYLKSKLTFNVLLFFYRLF